MVEALKSVLPRSADRAVWLHPRRAEPHHRGERRRASANRRRSEEVSGSSMRIRKDQHVGYVRRRTRRQLYGGGSSEMNSLF